MRGLQAIALSLLAGFGHPLTPFAFGQSEYSEAKIRAYWNKHDWKGALQYAKAWTQGEPNNATAWFQYCTLLNIEFQDSSEALNAMLKAVNLRPNFPAAWNGLGIIYMRRAQYGNAVNAFQRAVEQVPPLSEEC